MNKKRMISKYCINGELDELFIPIFGKYINFDHTGYYCKQYCYFGVDATNNLDTIIPEITQYQYSSFYKIPINRMLEFVNDNDIIRFLLEKI